MAVVTLHVNDKELQRVLTVLESLKEGLIEKMEIDKRVRYNRPKPISHEPPKPVEVSTKYVDPQTFKERLRKMRQKNG